MPLKNLKIDKHPPCYGGKFLFTCLNCLLLKTKLPYLSLSCWSKEMAILLAFATPKICEIG